MRRGNSEQKNITEKNKKQNNRSKFNKSLKATKRSPKNKRKFLQSNDIMDNF